MLKKRKLGRNINEINVGERLVFTDKMEDKELLLYLGLTDDANPLYIQHDYASKTKFKAPIVPAIMLMGTIFSTISKYFPGPGSHIISQNISFPQPVYHEEYIHFSLEVKEVNKEEEFILIDVNAHNKQEQVVVIGDIKVATIIYEKTKLEKIIDNF